MDLYRKSMAEYVTTVTVTDPLTGGDVTLGIYRDPVSGALVGLDDSFEEDVSTVWPEGEATMVVSVFNPYNASHILILPNESTA